MPAPLVTNTLQGPADNGIHETACKVIPGRRKGDTKWVVIFQDKDSVEYTVVFSSEDEARAAADSAGHTTLSAVAQRDVLSATDLLLHKPIWRI